MYTPLLNCSLCFDSGLFGEKGLACDDSVGCVCPEGYSGIDDWQITPSCRINDEARKITHRALLGCSLVGMLVSIVCALVLLRNWRFCCFGHSDSSLTDSGRITSQVSVDNDYGHRTTSSSHRDFPSTSLQTSLPSPTPMSSIKTTRGSRKFFTEPKRKGNYEVHQENLRNWKRGTGFTKLCMISFLLCLSGTLYHSLFLVNFPTSRSEGKIGIDFALTSIFICGGIYGVFLIRCYFHSLPNVTKYGGLLGLSNFLMHHPDFIYKSTRALMTIISIFPPIFFLILPNIENNLRPLSDKLGIIFLNIFILFNFALVLFMVQQVNLILKMCLMFSPQKHVNGNKLNNKQLRSIRAALRASRSIKTLAITVLIVMLPVETIDIFYNYGEDYVVCNFELLFYYLGSSVVCIGAVYIDANFKKNPTQ